MACGPFLVLTLTSGEDFGGPVEGVEIWGLQMGSSYQDLSLDLLSYLLQSVVLVLCGFSDI